MSDESGRNPFAAPEDRADGSAAPGGSAAVPGMLPGYGPTPGSAAPPVHGSAAGSVAPPAYGSAPAYGAGSGAGAPPASGVPAYGAGQGAGTAPGYGTAGTAYGATPGYGSAPAYGAAGYGSAPGYGATPGYGSAPAYGAAGAPAGPGYAPGYGAYPAPYGAYPPAPQGMDGLAIGAFVTALVGVLFFAGVPAPVSLILGIWALVRVRGSGRGGKGFAIAAIVISTVAIVAWIAFIVLMGVLSSRGTFDTIDSASTTDGYTLRSDLMPGTCLDHYPQTFAMIDAYVVDCAAAHGAEVVARTSLTGPVTIGLDGQPTGELFDDALAQCQDEIDGLLPISSQRGIADVFFSDPDHWATESAAYCVYVSADADLTGSVVAHAADGNLSS